MRNTKWPSAIFIYILSCRNTTIFYSVSGQRSMDVRQKVNLFLPAFSLPCMLKRTVNIYFTLWVDSIVWMLLNLFLPYCQIIHIANRVNCFVTLRSLLCTTKTTRNFWTKRLFYNSQNRLYFMFICTYLEMHSYLMYRLNLAISSHERLWPYEVNSSYLHVKIIILCRY